MNEKFYICSKFSDVVLYVMCHMYLRKYGTLRVWINGTLRYVAVSYVTLCYVRVENGQQSGPKMFRDQIELTLNWSGPVPGTGLRSNTINITMQHMCWPTCRGL